MAFIAPKHVTKSMHGKTIFFHLFHQLTVFFLFPLSSILKVRLKAHSEFQNYCCFGLDVVGHYIWSWIGERYAWGGTGNCQISRRSLSFHSAPVSSQRLWWLRELHRLWCYIYLRNSSTTSQLFTMWQSVSLSFQKGGEDMHICLTPCLVLSVQDAGCDFFFSPPTVC